MEENLYMYSFTHPKQKESAAVLYFNLDKKLVKIDFNFESTDVFKNALLSRKPINIEALILIRKAGAVVKDITNFDLSFVNFWKCYGNKNGNKKTCENKYKKLSKEEKVLAFGGIRKMRAYSEAKKYGMPYPQTYLNGRYWENELSY